MRGYFFRQAWQNLTQNPWLNAITLGTITLSFLVLGVFLILFLNTKGLLEDWGGADSSHRLPQRLPEPGPAEPVAGEDPGF